MPPQTQIPSSRVVKHAIRSESMLVFSEVARTLRPEGGRPLHVSTLNRWRDAGIAGVRLEAVRLGGRWATSLEAVDRFLAGVTEARTRPAAAAPRPRRTATGLNLELDAEGL